MKKKLCALTFDDGPNTTVTVQMLDVLESFNIPASFFLVGNLINGQTEKIIQRAADAGCSIQNHSFTHSDMKTMEPETVRKEFDMTSNLIESCVGIRPSFFRPPYISVSPEMFDAIQVPFICGLGIEDWLPEVTAEERSRRILTQIKDGTMVLLHDFEGNTPTVEAVKRVVPVLRDRGYEFVTVPELFRRTAIDSSVKNRKSDSSGLGKIWTNVYE